MCQQGAFNIRGAGGGSDGGGIRAVGDQLRAIQGDPLTGIGSGLGGEPQQFFVARVVPSGGGFGWLLCRMIVQNQTDMLLLAQNQGFQGTKELRTQRWRRADEACLFHCTCRGGDRMRSTYRGGGDLKVEMPAARKGRQAD